VWVVREGKGYKAWIAIADVSSYVTPDTAIDEEARLRACSVYLPDRAIPMLPRALSSNLCSLLPDEVRLCLCAVVTLDQDGTITSSELVRGFMKSAAKLTYSGVAKVLGFTKDGPDQPLAQKMKADLEVAAELSALLRKARMRRGALDFDLPEAKVVWDENKEPKDIAKRSQDPGIKKAYQLIEELMLLANEVVAVWLVEKNIPGIFRVHPPPDPEKLMRLAEMCEVLGVPFDGEEAQNPKALGDLVKRFAAHEAGSVLNMLLLRSMKQASYDRQNLGHFGLASKAYLHFTSPIRRYPDLVVHRQVHRVLLGERIDTSDEATKAIEEAASLASSGERRAMELERDVLDCYKCIIMRDRVGESFAGTVTSIVGSGLYIALDDPFVDVMVKFEHLGRETYEVDDTGLRVVATRSGESIALGDTITVEIMEANLQRRQILGRRMITSADGSTRAAGSRMAPSGRAGGRFPAKAGQHFSQQGSDATHSSGRGKSGRGASARGDARGSSFDRQGQDRSRGKPRGDARNIKSSGRIPYSVAEGPIGGTRRGGPPLSKGESKQGAELDQLLERKRKKAEKTFGPSAGKKPGKKHGGKKGGPKKHGGKSGSKKQGGKSKRGGR
jgi:ribonuclease R